MPSSSAQCTQDRILKLQQPKLRQLTRQQYRQPGTGCISISHFLTNSFVGCFFTARNLTKFCPKILSQAEGKQPGMGLQGWGRSAPCLFRTRSKSDPATGDACPKSSSKSHMERDQRWKQESNYCRLQYHKINAAKNKKATPFGLRKQPPNATESRFYSVSSPDANTWVCQPNYTAQVQSVMMGNDCLS